MGALIARLPNLAQITAVCKAGADNQPVLYHYAMSQTVRLFGNDALGLRVPSLIGFSVACICVYVFVSRRSAGVWGLLSVLFLLQTKAWWFATDGRPYGLMLGFAGVAVVCWQNIVISRSRLLSLIGLGISLLCAFNTHYFAVLLLIPFWAGEAVRTFIRRRIDWPVWACCSLPALVLLAYAPIIKAAKPNSGIPFAHFARPSIWNFFDEFFTPTLATFACGFVVYGASLYLRRRFKPAAATDFPARDYAPEAVAVIAFCTIPVFAVLLAKYGTHIFFPRYGIAGAFGFAVLAGVCGWLVFARQTFFGWTLVATLGLLLLHGQKVADIADIRDSRADPPGVVLPLRLPAIVRNDNLPIAFADLHDYMQFFYYGDAPTRSRAFYPADEKLAAHYLGFTFHERMMIGSAPFFGTQIVQYAAFIHDHKKFYVLGSLEYSAWLVRALLADGISLKMVQGGPKDLLGGFYDTCLLANVPENY